MMDDNPTFERHGDDLGGFRYDEEFDLDQLGRSGGDVISVSNDDDHMDVIEYNEDFGMEHHRIEGKPGEDIRDFLDE
ncbi:hypothetical protein K0C01_12090 [Salinarchaeum sp. IM2453]|uniref:hypothetical protein n=1 Tax=Salinarchaeum sp. IM2453 TaxID=2862870 RepID=UPI001C82CF9B|nr:hypothetical protein [Salinarchaeum sp. IM2453]QZA88503.1 hypothetical protein K0C01_12090 [Salinarchaeum sp. IM2453]